MHTRVLRRKNIHILEIEVEGVQGLLIFKAHPLDDKGTWWIDLVRVGHPMMRGQGYGNFLLEQGLAYLERQGATNVGLEPHAIGKERFDLASWYKRHGFVHEDGNDLWLHPPT